MKKSFIWLDGTFVPWEQATIHIATHTLHYGSGAFEGIRCYETENGPAIFRLHDHVERLLQSFSCFNVVIPWTKSELEKAIVDTLKINNLKTGYIRPIMFFGSSSLMLSPQGLSVHCAIITLDMDSYLDKETVHVGISTFKRLHPESVPIHNKINGFYVNSILACHEVKNRGFDEALFLDCEGTISEGAVANIFFVIDGKLKTPRASILPGITRSTVLTLAQTLNIPTEEGTITLSDISQAKEAFFCGTAREITPIKAIETISFDILGSITQKIKNMYATCTSGKNKCFGAWLTLVQ